MRFTKLPKTSSNVSENMLENKKLKCDKSGLIIPFLAKTKGMFV